MSAKNYTVEDFPLVQCDSVDDQFYQLEDLKRQLSGELKTDETPMNLSNYTRKITLHLKPGEDANHAIELLMSREDVLNAEKKVYVYVPEANGYSGGCKILLKDMTKKHALDVREEVKTLKFVESVEVRCVTSDDLKFYFPHLPIISNKDLI